MENNKKRLIVIDSNSIIHRAFHALPSLTTKKGEIVGAVYGFMLVFLKTIKDFQPDFIVACFDLPGLTFRHKQFKEYKAKRPPTPKQLSQQIPRIKEILKAFEVAVFEKQGFEADDLIGTLAHLASKERIAPEGEEDKSFSSRFASPRSARVIETIILSGDSDTFQLINSQTKVYALRKGVKDIVLYDKELIKEKYQGLEPKQLIGLKALRGDPSDNIPGVLGIGEKTAIKLLLEFNNLENLYQEIEKDSEKARKIKPKLKKTLIKYKEQAFLSKMLAEIKCDIPIDFRIDKCRFQDYNKEGVKQILKKFEFHSLINRLPQPTNVNPVRKDGALNPPFLEIRM